MIDSAKKSMNKVATFNILGMIILNGVNFFTIPIFTRALGTENYGIFSLYTATVSIFTIIVNLEVAGTVGNACMKYKEEKSYLLSIALLSTISFCVIFCIVLYFVSSLEKFLGLNRKIIYLAVLHGYFSGIVNIITGYFTFKKDVYKTFFISIFNVCVGTILSILLLNRLRDNLYISRVLGTFFPLLFLGIVGLFYLILNGKKVDFTHWKFCLNLCIPLIFHDISHIILNQSDRIMIRNITRLEANVGIYSFIHTFTNVLNIIWSALNSTWIPFYYEYENSKNFHILNSMKKNYIILFTGIIVGFLMTSREVIKLLSSNEYWSGMKLVPMLVISVYFIFLYSFPVNFEFFYGKTIYIAIGTSLATTCNIVLNILFINRWGNLGAAIATSLSYFILFSFHQIISRFFIDRIYFFCLKDIVGSFMIVFIMSVLYYKLEKFVFIRWGIAAVTGFFLVRRIVKRKSLF